MDTHLINSTLSPEDRQAIGAAIDTLRQKLPFLIDLTVPERRRMPKAADKTRAFIRKAVDIANEHPQMFASAFLDEMRNDAKLLDDLSPISLAVRLLAKKLDDTGMQVSAEAFAAARTVYAVTKTPFAKAALRTAADELGKRWQKPAPSRSAAQS